MTLYGVVRKGCLVSCPPTCWAASWAATRARQARLGGALFLLPPPQLQPFPSPLCLVYLFLLEISEPPKNPPFLFVVCCLLFSGFLCLVFLSSGSMGSPLREVGSWQSSEPINHRPSLMLTIAHRTDDADRKKGWSRAECDRKRAARPWSGWRN